MKPDGTQNGDAMVEGAVTVGLNHDQVRRAENSSAFWVQGGTPEQPLPTIDGTTYGFGALRCAVDNLNGDNVEWIRFDKGVKHVFCYAYYVANAPDEGTITIVKKVEGVEEGGDAPAFGFKSNASYIPDESFTLDPAQGQASAEEVFVRSVTSAFGKPYTFEEKLTEQQAAAGWRLVGDPVCVGGATPSTVHEGVVSVTLAADEHITCTFTNRLTEPEEPPVPAIDVAATAVCRNDTPWLDYSVTPSGFVPSQLIVTWSTVDGEVVATDEFTGEEFSTAVLTGSLLWPGAELDANGDPIDWPGWTLVNGSWVQDPNDLGGNLRPETLVTFELNPTSEAVHVYPPATPDCDPNPYVGPTPGPAAPTAPPSAGGGSNLAYTGASVGGIGLAALLLAGLGVGLYVVSRRRAAQAAIVADES